QLGELRRRPGRFVAVLVGMVRILTCPSGPRPPKPEEPVVPSPRSSPSEATSVGDEDPATVEGPQAPRRQLAVATVLAPDVERALSFEWISQPLDAEHWRTVLQDAAPDLLLVSDVGWSSLQTNAGEPVAWSDILHAYRAAGIPCVFWDT